MSEPWYQPYFSLEIAWRRIAELEREVRHLTRLAVENERLVQANADLEAGLIRLNHLVNELVNENARLRCEGQAAQAGADW